MLIPAAAIVAACGAKNEGTALAPEAMSGVWQIENPNDALKTADGKEPPLLAASAKLYQERIALRQQGDTSFDSATWCASAGTPRMMLLNSPFEIIVQPLHVAFLHEWNWWARVVYLEGALKAAGPPPEMPPPPPGGPPPGGPPPGGPPGGPPPGPPPDGGDGVFSGPPGSIGGSLEFRLAMTEATGPMGLSRGRWDGNTLVIETTAMRDTTLLDNAGLPRSDALKVTERVRLLSADVLEDRFRFEDPHHYSEPWEAVVTYKRQAKEIQEDVCLDRIRDGQPALP
jgi:hypothetical protein